MGDLHDRTEGRRRSVHSSNLLPVCRRQEGSGGTHHQLAVQPRDFDPIHILPLHPRNLPLPKLGPPINLATRTLVDLPHIELGGLTVRLDEVVVPGDETANLGAGDQPSVAWRSERMVVEGDPVTVERRREGRSVRWSSGRVPKQGAKEGTYEARITLSSGMISGFDTCPHPPNLENRFNDGGFFSINPR